MFPMSLVCGNTCVMKPSERDPGATMMLVQMAQDAGVPDGCVNVIHGAHDCELTNHWLQGFISWICQHIKVHIQPNSRATYAIQKCCCIMVSFKQVLEVAIFRAKSWQKIFRSLLDCCFIRLVIFFSNFGKMIYLLV